MAVAEPSNDFGLWAEVKAITGWPDTDEDRVQGLAEAWTASAGHFATAAAADPSAGGWQDEAGTAYAQRAGQAVTTAATMDQGMQVLASGAELFAAEVRQTKQAIADYIDQCVALYGAAASLPGGVDAAFRQTFVSQVAAEVRQLLQDTADRIRTTLAPFQELISGGTAGVETYSALNRTIRGGLALSADVANARAQNLYRGIEGLITAHLTALGKSPSEINRALAGIEQRNLLQARGVADAAQQLADSRYADFAKAVVPASKFMKSVAGVGVVSDAYDLIKNPDGETGVRRGISVAADLAGIGAGGAALAAGAGLVALTPVGLGLVAAGLVFSGGWAAGEYVYDHWDDITHGAQVAGDWVGGLVS
ncbi:hypothetical protein BWI15_28525 [Kribbella sp. ALI-6-A]|uniref:WXG100-like domain-containing protein n=1 Tax=Kribbella sp. ALI-6-A TaxID=1933817 RepID=UPI00097C651F|nr:hypothetical protein [Kribbella sp. ALI-6-A]ONI67116.1 hypothetical protein BWI15_28525 [Kribbella sp. ALI-6-A]